MPASGGTGSIAVKTERECQWTAQSDASWLSINSGATGQGDGSVQFTAGANADPVSRSGGIMLNGQRAQVTQAAADCHFDLGQSSASFPQAGGSGTVDVRASSQLCSWTATSDSDWIAIRSGGSGKGSAQVGFTVAATTGPPRVGTLTIAGLHFSVNQSEGCAFIVAPLNQSADASGGTGTVTVTGGPGCVWTASSNAPWLTITSGSSGNGPGSVTFSIGATSGASRTGTLVVAGQTVTVTQGQGCTFAIAPETQSIPSSGGSGTVTVTAGGGCTWTAASAAPWITIGSGASGTGNGTVSFNVAATSGPGRAGTLTIAGKTFTVNQGQGCAFSLSSSSASEPAGGGNGSFDVRTADGCAWTASSSAPWLTISSGANGTGNGTVRFAAAATTGPQRTGTITAAGLAFTVTQGGGCTYSISPASQSLPSAGGNTAVAVTASGGCSWTASSNAPWITISSGASGSGNGSVQLAVAATTDAARSGTVTIAGQTFTVNQSSGCAYAIAPTSQAVAAGGGGGSFTVTTGASCTWTAASTVPWTTVTSGAAGTGNGTVQFTVAANTGSARSGTITAGGQTFSIAQDAGCSFAVAPDTLQVAAGGGSPTVGITAGAPDCAWTAASNVPWISITVGAGGTGNGTSQLDVQGNSGPPRSGTATVAGRTVTVNQDSGCSFSLTPSAQPMVVGGGASTVMVNASGGCSWTAVSNVPWITITAGANGTGGGNVQFTVDANATGAARDGTMTIAGQTFTVSQAGS